MYNYTLKTQTCKASNRLKFIGKYEDLEEEELSLHDKQMIEIMELMGWN